MSGAPGTLSEPAPTRVAGDGPPAGPTAAADEPGSEARRSRGPGRRVLAYALTVLALVAINFALPRAMPGDPITAMVASAGAGSGQATIPDAAAATALESYYGLDRPLPDQFASYVSGLVRGDLGTSVRERVPVAEMLADRLPWTLLLMGTALTIAVTVGLLAGIASGWRAGGRRDRTTLTAVVTVQQIPSYVLATVALLVLAATLGWLPLGGATTPFASDLGGLARIGDVGRHLLLPGGVLAAQLAASTYLYTRGAMVGEVGAPYLRLGRAKGLDERRLKYRYAGRNALLPVVSLTAMQLAFATSGSIFVETVFSYPGVGRMMFDAVAARDYPVLQGGFLVLSLAVVTANLAADLLYARLDPRVAS